MSFFENISNLKCINRIYYGNSTKKPNEHCYYDGGSLFRILDGWYEDDNHLRNRITDRIDFIKNISITTPYSYSDVEYVYDTFGKDKTLIVLNHCSVFGISAYSLNSIEIDAILNIDKD